MDWQSKQEKKIKNDFLYISVSIKNKRQINKHALSFKVHGANQMFYIILIM